MDSRNSGAAGAQHSAATDPAVAAAKQTLRNARAGGTAAGANDSVASVRGTTATTQMLQYAHDRGLAAAAAWFTANARYRELEAFRNSWVVGYSGVQLAPSLLQQIGHSNVPQSQGYLGGWVYHQRTDSWVYSRHTERRARNLDDLHFNWENNTHGHQSTPPMWDQRLAQLVKYKAEHVNCNAPQRQGSMGGWLNKQRAALRNEDVDARRKLQNKLSARRKRKREQDSLDSVKKLVEEYDETISELKTQLTALGNPSLVTEIFDELEKSAEEEELGTNEVSNPTSDPTNGNGPKGQNVESTCPGMKPDKPIGVTSPDEMPQPAFDSNGKIIGRPLTVAPVINGEALPTAPDEEKTRKLRRMMRNRDHARRSRERKKKEVDALNAQRIRKESQISKMRSILESTKGKSVDDSTDA